MCRPQTVLDFERIDHQNYKIQLPIGTKLYRNVPVGADPLRPVGRAMRFVTEPAGFDPSQYKPGVIEMGTGALCFAQTPRTSNLETPDLEQKDLYELTLVQDIDIYDLDSICKNQGISKPYMDYLKGVDFTEFYGKRINGLRYESRCTPTEYNIVIFHDWFIDFKKYVSLRKIEI